MAHGNIYKPEKVDAALGNYFRVGNLTALRELALLWLADKVDDQLDRYRRDHGIEGTWEARERVVVALTGGPEGDTLIRRAARIAERARGADLLAVHVVHTEGLSGPDPAHLARQRTLIESIGGTYHQVVGDDIPQALLSYARGVNATQLVLGASRRGRFAQLFSRSIGVTTVAESGPIDVHLVTHEETRRPRLRWPWRREEPLGRLLLGLTLTAVLMPALTIVLTQFRNDLSLSSVILIFLVAVVVISLVGRLWAAFAAALVGSLLLNYYFTPPIYTWTISDTQNVLALVRVPARRAHDQRHGQPRFPPHPAGRTRTPGGKRAGRGRWQRPARVPPTAGAPRAVAGVIRPGVRHPAGAELRYPRVAHRTARHQQMDGR